MYKKLINIVLVLVLCVTVLPIEQVGNALFNNTWTEEVNEHAEHQVVKFSKFTLDDDFAFGLHVQGMVARSVPEFAEYSQTLPGSVSFEIHSPPPNML